MNRFRTIWQHLRRSPYQTILAISITGLTFFVVGLVTYTAFLSSSLLTYFEQKPQVTVFFSDKKSEASIQQLEERLKHSGKIAKMRYISKEEALKIYQEQNKNDPLLLEMVTADILPASLEIQAVDPKYLAEIVGVLKGEEGTDEIIYQKDIIDTLLKWTSTIRSTGIALIIFFSLLSILVTLTITGMKIVLRRKEIEILKLVGATRGYICGPFITEGVLYGLLGSLIGWIFTYVIILYATPFFSTLFQGIPSLSISLKTGDSLSIFSSFSVWPVSWQLMLIELGLLLGTGILLGAMGSLIALWRYVRF